MARKFKTDIGHEAFVERPSPPMIVSEFVPRVKRNEDLFRFLSPVNGIVKNLMIFAVMKTGLAFFTVNSYLYNQYGCTQTSFEVKPGMSYIDDMEMEIERGDRLRLDIEGIDEVYKEISEVEIAFTISPKSRI